MEIYNQIINAAKNANFKYRRMISGVAFGGPPEYFCVSEIASRMFRHGHKVVLEANERDFERISRILGHHDKYRICRDIKKVDIVVIEKNTNVRIGIEVKVSRDHWRITPTKVGRDIIKLRDIKHKGYLDKCLPLCIISKRYLNHLNFDAELLRASLGDSIHSENTIGPLLCKRKNAVSIYWSAHLFDVKDL